MAPASRDAGDSQSTPHGLITSLILVLTVDGPTSINFQL